MPRGTRRRRRLPPFWSSPRSTRRPFRRRRRSHNRGMVSVRQEPNLKRSPGNSVKATTIGAACGSCGTSLMGGRARLPLPSSSSASCPSNRSTANSRSSRVEQLHRCGVQRLEAFRVGYAGVRFFGRPFDSPPVSAHAITPSGNIDGAPRGGLHLHGYRHLIV